MLQSHYNSKNIQNLQQNRQLELNDITKKIDCLAYCNNLAETKLKSLEYNIQALRKNNCNNTSTVNTS